MPRRASISLNFPLHVVVTILEKKISDFPSLRHLLDTDEKKTSFENATKPPRSSPAVAAQHLVPAENLQNFGGHTFSLADSLAWMNADVQGSDACAMPSDVKMEPAAALHGHDSGSASTLRTHSTSDFGAARVSAGPSVHSMLISSMHDNGQHEPQSHMASTGTMGQLASATGAEHNLQTYAASYQVVDGILAYGPQQDPFATFPPTAGPALWNPDPWMGDLITDAPFNT